MSRQIKVLRLEDLESILLREERRLESEVDDPIQRKFDSWHAKWRRESLEHYLPLGWSMAIWNESGEEILAYFLGQPFLFFRGLTQSLWIEHFSTDDDSLSTDLIEVACKMAREKHFQTVIFHDAHHLESQLESWQPKILNDSMYAVKTAKF